MSKRVVLFSDNARSPIRTSESNFWWVAEPIAIRTLVTVEALGFVVFVTYHSSYILVHPPDFRVISVYLVEKMYTIICKVKKQHHQLPVWMQKLLCLAFIVVVVITTILQSITGAATTTIYFRYIVRIHCLFPKSSWISKSDQPKSLTNLFGHFLKPKMVCVCKRVFALWSENPSILEETANRSEEVEQQAYNVVVVIVTFPVVVLVQECSFYTCQCNFLETDN